jgi:hypothetical protein
MRANKIPGLFDIMNNELKCGIRQRNKKSQLQEEVCKGVDKKGRAISDPATIFGL